MLHKTLACCALALIMAKNALAGYDVIRPEDEDLLTGIMNNPVQIQSEEILYIPTNAAPARPLQEEPPALKDDEPPLPTAPKKATKTSFLPDKSQFEQEKKQWYDPELTRPASLKEQSPALSDQEGQTAAYRAKINACLQERQNNLEMEKSFILKDNVYDTTAYISQTFEEINRCYENIGLDIIDAYYDGSPELKQKFDKIAQSFYLKSADPDFNPEFCEETCSLDALIKAQIAKFADFRAYLAELIENAPHKG